MSTALKEKVREKIGARKRVGEILLERGQISAETLAAAVKSAEKRRVPVGVILLEAGVVGPEALAQALAEHFGLEYVDLAQMRLSEEVLAKFPEHLALKHRMVPVSHSIEDGWRVAVEDPRLIEQNDILRGSLPKPYRLMVGSRAEIDQALNRYYASTKRKIEELARQVVVMPTASGKVSIDALIEALIGSAVSHKASDIHIDPADGFVRIRERIDGVLNETYQLDKQINVTLISKLKVMASLDITEKRKPQDGRFHFDVQDQSVDVRMSCLPTIRGERVVLRLLRKSKQKVTLEEIGFPPERVQAIKEILEIPHGIILVTGPTGSGKTTTVYGMLTQLDSLERNIITVEDPVEYQFDVINQVQIQPKSGLNFVEILRNILRQDPDVIMVGEVRDKETADLAIRAALTGHLVISTIHTNDSLSTISRLIDMGIDPFLVSATLTAIISQRLVRKLCPQCSREGAPVGCFACNETGYSGRTAVSELLVPDEVIRQGIVERMSLVQMEKHLRALGFKTMADDGQAKVQARITSAAEVKKLKS